MKLSNFLLYRAMGIMLLVIAIWSGVYFFLQMYEIHDGIDEGLINLKQEFVLDANADTTFVEDMIKHNPLNLRVEEIAKDHAIRMEEHFFNSYIYFETEQEEEEVRMLETAFYCTSNQKYYKLQVFTTTVESDDLIKNILFLQVALFLVLTIVLYFAGRILIEKAFQPFYRLLKHLHHFRLGASEMFDLPQTPIREFNELNQSVAVLLKENMAVYQEEKRFIENASHELQTPLAIVTGKLEMLIGEKDITPDQATSIAASLQILNRMKRLNANLLLLSKIHNKQFPQTEQISLSEIFIQSLKEYESLIEHKEISVAINGTDDFFIEMNKDLAFIMVNNLVKNAIVHNIQGGKVQLTFNKERIEIRNTGNPTQLENIFERYQTQSEHSHSLGLGLSIVKSITSLYAINIIYSFDGEHVFKINFEF